VADWRHRVTGLGTRADGALDRCEAKRLVAFELGRPGEAGLALVRLHSECLTGDVFGSQRCDCGPQLREAVERIANHGGLVFCPPQVADGLDGLPGVEVISSGRNVELAAMLAPRAASVGCSPWAAP
jgi:hypothetical protein